ncbi:hypothetical protein C5Y97_17700 [Blastopirellula marina]|uniref:Uncharacterized protein n=1 Tax=Blastopirellula marina TaxID=124 RepID=A0A2S8FLS9_9BACT|nr:hypothetical protein C5Y98_17690 [Blastopirellula marina]PTL43137.1 hypothetical protein C5Y97_17700 [Blastopirellula marina]
MTWVRSDLVLSRSGRFGTFKPGLLRLAFDSNRSRIFSKDEDIGGVDLELRLGDGISMRLGREKG